MCLPHGNRDRPGEAVANEHAVEFQDRHDAFTDGQAPQEISNFIPWENPWSFLCLRLLTSSIHFDCGSQILFFLASRKP